MESTSYNEKMRKAQEKYVKVSTRTYSIRYNKIKDADVIETLDRTKNKQAYIKELIRKDIKSNDGSVKETANAQNSKQLIDISYEPEQERWKAVSSIGRVSLISDSYDKLLEKISKAVTGEYTIRTAEQHLGDKEDM